MSVKAKAPEEDPETKRRRELEQARADAEIVNQTREDVAREGIEIARQFGRRPRSGTIGSLANISLNDVIGSNLSTFSGTTASALARASSTRTLGSITAREVVA